MTSERQQHLPQARVVGKNTNGGKHVQGTHLQVLPENTKRQNSSEELIGNLQNDKQVDPQNVIPLDEDDLAGF